MRSQLDCKVTPYTIINYSSKVIFVRSVFYTDGEKLKEYIIPPGESVEYEVNYDEEVRHLMRDRTEEVVKKQDFLNIAFEGSPYQIKGKSAKLNWCIDVNLRN